MNDIDRKLVTLSDHAQRFRDRFLDLFVPQLLQHAVHHVHERSLTEVVLGSRVRRDDHDLTGAYVWLDFTLREEY